MTSKTVEVRYRHQPATAKPHFVSNDDVRRIAADVRRQIGCGDADRLRREHLLGIGAIRANGIHLGVCWSVDHPVTDDRGAAVLGVCEYDHRGLPDTALISVNPVLAGDGDGLLLGTLAHELGHAIFDVPGWRTMAGQQSLPGLLGDEIQRVYRAVTTDEDHLTGPARKAGERDFVEWRANEFMGSLLVPRRRLGCRLRHHAARLQIPVEKITCADLLASASEVRIAGRVDAGRFDLALNMLLTELADDFGVSLKFVRVRLVRYGLATGEQLGMP